MSHCRGHYLADFNPEARGWRARAPCSSPGFISCGPMGPLRVIFSLSRFRILPSDFSLILSMSHGDLRNRSAMFFAHCRSILFWFQYCPCLIKTKTCDPNSVIVSSVVLCKDQYCSLYAKTLSACPPFLEASSNFLSRVQVSHCQPIANPRLENLKIVDFPPLCRRS